MITNIPPRSYRRNVEILDFNSVPTGMCRIALQVEYNGSSYHGFQRQKTTSKTVQAELERALSKVANEPITLVCSGRTDTGVHATAQVIHFDTLAVRDLKAWIIGVNSNLPHAVRVIDAVDAGFNFHARFSAISRTYCYLMHPSKFKSSHLDSLVTWVKLTSQDPAVLSVDSMQQAANHLRGEHNFASFQASGCQAKTSVRTIEHISIEQRGPLVALRVTANAFLQHMVRNIVGFMLRVGKGQLPPAHACYLIEAADRTCAPETASADGLYFVGVAYPETLNIDFKSREPLLL